MPRATLGPFFLSGALALACTTESGDPLRPGVAPPAGGSGGAAAAGDAGSAGSVSSSSGAAGSAGAAVSGGGSAGQSGGQSPAAGSGGVAGSAGAGGSGNADACGSPPTRDLKFEAADGQHLHTANGHAAAVYGGVPKMMGKLIVQLDDNVYNFGLKRGFHVLAVNLPICPIHYQSREHNGDCRLEVFDGVDRVPDFSVMPEQTVVSQVTKALSELHAAYPEEDWGFFLDADGTVRWSDVGFTGHSHRAQSATRFGVAVCAYRVVARAGPRDNTCGTGVGETDFDAQMPPYDVSCPEAEISAWLDETPKTPLDRFFGFVGKEDEQYGDILFTMERMKFVGQPVNITSAQAPYGGSHRFYADVGHDGFDSAPFYDALNLAWGVPPENAAWALTH